jgi:hypothetical protein
VAPSLKLSRGQSKLTPAERKLRSQLAAHESWAGTENPTERTANARAAFRQRFLDEASGDPVRAEHLRKAFYARMAFESAKARRQAKQSKLAALKAEIAALEAEEAAGGDSDVA